MIFQFRDRLIKRYIIPRAAKSIVMSWRPVADSPDAAAKIYRLLIEVFERRLEPTEGMQKPGLGNASLVLLGLALICHGIYLIQVLSGVQMSTPWLKLIGLIAQSVAVLLMLFFSHQGFMAILSLDWSNRVTHPQQATAILGACLTHCQLALFFLFVYIYFEGFGGVAAVLVNLILLPGSFFMMVNHFKDQYDSDLSSSELSLCLSALSDYLSDDIKIRVLNSRMEGEHIKLNLFLRAALNPQPEAAPELALDL